MNTPLDKKIKTITDAMVGKKNASGYSQLNKSHVYGCYYIDGAQEMEDGSLRIWVSNVNDDVDNPISFIGKGDIDYVGIFAEDYEEFLDELYNYVVEQGDLSFDTWK